MSRKRTSSNERRHFEQELLIARTIETLAALMNEARVSQRELARRLGVSPSRVSQIVAGQNVTLRTLADVGWALGLRFAAVGVPFKDRAGTPAGDDAASPEWLDAQRARLAASRDAR